MRDLKVLEMQIEDLRKQLNFEMENQLFNHIPSEKILELSKKMDELLNEYNSEYYVL